MILDTAKYEIVIKHELRYVQTVPTNSPPLFWHGALCFDKHPVDAPNGIQRESLHRHVVIMRWGNEGMSGHQSIKRFRALHDAQLYLRGRLRDKAKKGYLYADGTQAFQLGVSVPNTHAQSPPPRFVETDWDLFG